MLRNLPEIAESVWRLNYRVWQAESSKKITISFLNFEFLQDSKKVIIIVPTFNYQR